MFVIEGNILFAVFNGANDFALVVVFIENSFQTEAVGEVLRILGFAAGKVAFCEAQVVNGIQEVRFAGTVSTGDTYNTFIESEVLPGVIFKLDK
jgi:hypothetical protein